MEGGVWGLCMVVHGEDFAGFGIAGESNTSITWRGFRTLLKLTLKEAVDNTHPLGLYGYDL